MTPIELLRSLHFLRAVDDVRLAEFELEARQYAAGDEITRQGSRAEGLLLLQSGNARAVFRDPEGGEAELYRLEAGDSFGELELVRDQGYHAALLALDDCTVLHWPVDSLEAVLKEEASAMRGFKYTAESRRLALSLEFDWLGEDEFVHALARKDINILFQSLSLPGVIMVAGGVGAWWFSPLAGAQVGSGLAWLFGAGGVLGLALSIWRWLDWRNDYYIVTDRRVVWLEKVIGLYDSRQESPLHMVLSVSVSTDLLGRTLGYGDVIIRTYTGQITFKNVNDPRSMAAIIEQQWSKAKNAREREDREVVAAALQRGLEPGDSDEPGPETSAPPRQSLIEPEEQSARAENGTGLGHWTFEVRFEESGVITYRKHWAVLLRFIALPSSAIMLLVTLIGGHLGGLIRIFEPGAATLASLALLVPAGLWWLYQYMDWANDLYQITPENIVDVYKKPLARELRKLAPLENVLGTEVKRKGIFGLLLNYGDVVAQVGTAEFTFEGVLDPNRVQQDIVRAQEAFLERRRELERRERREELAQWFGVYHEERGAEPQGSSDA